MAAEAGAEAKIKTESAKGENPDSRNVDTPNDAVQRGQDSLGGGGKAPLKNKSN